MLPCLSLVLAAFIAVSPVCQAMDANAVLDESCLTTPPRYKGDHYVRALKDGLRARERNYNALAQGTLRLIQQTEEQRELHAESSLRNAPPILAMRHPSSELESETPGGGALVSPVTHLREPGRGKENARVLNAGEKSQKALPQRTKPLSRKAFSASLKSSSKGILYPHKGNPEDEARRRAAIKRNKRVLVVGEEFRQRNLVSARQKGVKELESRKPEERSHPIGVKQRPSAIRSIATIIPPLQEVAPVRNPPFLKKTLPLHTSRLPSSKTVRPKLYPPGRLYFLPGSDVRKIYGRYVRERNSLGGDLLN